MRARRFAIIGNTGVSMVNFRGPLIAEIVAQGVEVVALAPDYDDDTRAAVRALGAHPIDYSLSRTAINPLLDARSLASLFAVLLRLNLDAVLAFTIKPVIYGLLAARFAGVRARHALIPGLGYSYTDADDTSVGRRLVGWIARALYRLALSGSEPVFVQNPDDASELVRKRIAPATKVVTVNGTGVDLNAWKMVPPAISPITFTLAARLIRDKGILEFVEAARRIKARHPEARFLLLGGLDANPAAISSREVEGWVEAGVIEWPGHVPVRPWLAQTSVFVLPSYYREGVPRSTQEAMALGRPIITTDAPGCRETAIEGRNGFLVPPRDVGALVAAIERFIAAPGLIAEMGAASRAMAEERFDVRKVNARMIAEMGLAAPLPRTAGVASATP